MKVEIGVRVAGVKFSELESGETFVYGDGSTCTYLKPFLPSCITDVNAVELETSRLVCMRHDSIVRRVKLKVVLDN